MGVRRYLSGLTDNVLKRQWHIFLVLNALKLYEKGIGYKSEEELRRAYDVLEERVAERTTDLALTNKQLKQEVEQRKRAEYRLEEKNIELENAKLAKDRFLATMSHELSTALNAIIGFTNNIPDGQVVIRTHRRALSQILLNLTNNAIQFTEKGRVQLEFGRQQRGGRFVTEISVIDTGIGIREEDQKKLFEGFKHLDSALLRPREGTGLGLHLSQKLAELIGGEISLKSVHGKGSTFTLTLK